MKLRFDVDADGAVSLRLTPQGKHETRLLALARGRVFRCVQGDGPHEVVLRSVAEGSCYCDSLQRVGGQAVKCEYCKLREAATRTTFMSGDEKQK